MLLIEKISPNHVNASLTALASIISLPPIRFRLVIPADPLFADDVQWHLGFIGSLGFVVTKSATNTGGIEAVWADYRGSGVAVGVWDDGIQRTHWDLSANYDASRQVTINGLLNDGQPVTADDGHGTSVAGLIAADDNGRGGVGIAHDAKITAIRIFGGADDINSAWSRYLLTLDSLGQFDVTNHSYGGYPDFYKYGDVAKFEAAAVSGRGGLGTVNVKSAGNDDVDGNGEALDSSRFTVTVAAIGNNSTGNIASYSTYGAHVLVSAPAASVTTDLQGSGPGYDGLLDGDYTNGFGGTSAAGPVTAGVIALMLDANPGLGWRDVQNILAYSAIGVGSLYSGVATNEDSAWKWNGAANWNGGDLHFSEDYGYGLVNAYNAVRMAEVWSILHPQAATSATEAMVTTGTLAVNQSIADLATLNYSFAVAEDISLEHVALTVSLTHSYFTDLRIRLVSPDGAAMTLYDGSTGSGSTADGTLTYTFGADGYRGLGSAGTWTLQVQDASAADAGLLRSVAFTGYGSAASADSVYHYTDEVLSVLQLDGQSGRRVLADSDGGTDWVDAAAMAGNLVLDLDAASTSTVGGEAFLMIADATLIENAIGGDGNDRIEGNGAANTLYGMRGDDALYGMGGNDTLVGGDGLDIAGFSGLRSAYEILAAGGVTTVIGPDGTDTQTGFEVLRFADVDIDDPSAVANPSDGVAPTLVSSTPADNATAIAVGADLVLTFSEAVQAGSGAVDIYDAGGNLFERFEAGALAFSGSVVTINPSTSLAKDASYYVRIDHGAVKDLAGNEFAGIGDATTLNFSTEASVTVITGTSRSDRLSGTSRNDLIQGLGGNDSLFGKLGLDTLVGGAGKDYFIFDTAAGAGNVDTIQGFNVRDDTIRLENALFSRLTKTGALASASFRANSGGVALDSNDYVLLDTNTGRVFYDADGNGAGAALHLMTLLDVVGTVSASDFEVI